MATTSAKPKTPATLSVDPLERPANPRRGLTAAEPAEGFVQAFPVGSRLTPEQFDGWAKDQGLLTVPEVTDRQSDAWKAHLQRRHELKFRLNRAGTHPRMTDHGSTPFSIESVSSGVWEVRAPEIAIANTRMLYQVSSLLTTKRKTLRFLIESADWSVLPPWEVMFAKSLFHDINRFSNLVQNETLCLDQKFVELQMKFADAIAKGEMTASPAIQSMLSFPAPPETLDIC